MEAPTMDNEIDDEDYEVGYGKPPKEYQFKPGQSGNHMGRPPDDRNLKRALRDIMTEDLEIRENGKLRVVSNQEALLRAMYAKALKGDKQCAKILIDLSGKAPFRYNHHD